MWLNFEDFLLFPIKKPFFVRIVKYTQLTSENVPSFRDFVLSTSGKGYLSWEEEPEEEKCNHWLNQVNMERT